MKLSSNLALIVLLLACGNGKRGGEPQPVPIEPRPVVLAKPIPAEFFGTHYIAIWVSRAPWPDEMGIYRTHGATHRWHMCHAGPDQWYEQCHTRLTSVFQHWPRAREFDVPIIYVVGGGGQAVVPGNGITHSGIPPWISADTVGALENHLEWLIDEFGDDIDYYEVWNEPNAGNWFAGDAEDLLGITQVVHRVVSHRDSTAKIIGPSFTEGGHEMMDEFYGLGAAQYVDIIGWHHGITNPEADTTRILEVRRILTKHSIDKPLWATEMNVAGGASELVRTYLIHWIYGVENVGYYSWEMHDYGIPADSLYAHTVNEDGSVNEAGMALLELAERTKGRIVTSVLKSPSQWTVTFDGGMTITWNPNSNDLPVYSVES